MTRTISFITINKDDAVGLARTLRSFAFLRSQPGVEFVLIDGASQDDSLKVARSFYGSDEITSEPDLGIYDAMNKGLYKANGDFVVWINSGDEFSGNLGTLQKVRSSDADIVGFGSRVIFPDDPARNFDYLSDPMRLPLSTLPHASTYFRRNLVLNLGGYDTRWSIVADRKLILSAYNSGARFEFITETAAKFYHGGISSSSAFYLETIRLNHELGLIGLGGFIGRYIKYYLFIRRRTKRRQASG